MVVAATLGWLIIAAIVHLTQGTADYDAATVWRVITGAEIPQAAAVLIDSRLPRLLAALVVGAALGASGAAMQSVSRNPLASPDTTGVAAGAFLALTVAAVVGLSPGPIGGLAIAFVGGVAAAAAVIGLASGGTLSPMRLVLAGSALTLGLGSITSVLLLVFPWQTQGLFVWGAGSLSQNGPRAVLTVLPFLAIALVVLLLYGRRLDLLQLGEDTAASLGVPVAATRRAVIVCAVVLAACSVTVAGPIGFVGLVAPAIIGLLRPWAPPLRRQRTFVVLSAIAGVALVLTADVLLRILFGGVAGVTMPTGVLTSLIGALFLILLARRVRSGGAGEALITMHAGTAFGRAHPILLIGLAVAVLIGVTIAGVLIGDRLVLLGDVWNWVRGAAAPRVEIILGSRVPRVIGALLAGICLALAGALLQAVTRNPLADPGILGISASAGFGAIAVITIADVPSDRAVFAAALVGAAIAALLLAVIGRADQLRMVLVGVGIGAAASALTTLLIIGTDPWNQTKAITWLGGSTYGTTAGALLPMLVVVIVAAVVVSRAVRDLDLLQFDEITPRVLGVAVGRQRLLHIGLAVALTAVATATIGVIAFVGLVAPHAARLLIGKRHATLLPLAAVFGAILVVAGDLLGRAVLAPSQIPAGLVVALIGTPYFLWLLRRMRSER
ncbi:iron ABC transporter permease [Millisia brevis]|uniref:iron ABC transporter permease n=1 Tax=Millisia brevis TaxID=264148 RepID=UPI001C3F4045|nr:iron ABC transporter permease [Millisia brevis]